MSERQSKFSIIEQFSLLAWLFRFAKPYWGMFLFSVIGMILTSAIAAILPIIIQRYIDDYLALGQASLSLAAGVAAVYLALMLVKNVLTYLKDYYFKLASEKTVANMREQTYEKVVHFGMRYFDQTPNGSIVSRVTNDTETIKEFWNVFLTFANGLFNAISIGIAMFALNSNLAWIFMAFIPIIIGLIYFYQYQSTIIYRRMREALSDLNTKLSEYISGMAIIQSFNQTSRIKKDFDEVNQTYVDARINMFKMNAVLLNPAINLLESIALILVLLIVGNQQLQVGGVDIGVLYAFTEYSKSFFRPIGQMMDSLSIYQDGLVAASRVRRLMNNQEEAPSQNEPANGQIRQGGIEVKNLSFSYDGENNVLNDISFSLKPGETIAFVGQTGSGKSTIINVLMRFYEYSQGEITIDGQNLKDIDMENIRQDMGLVLQDSFLFYGNIRDNITLHADFDQSHVEAAARFVHANHFIEQLPGGYDAKVIENGAAFSTGQRQLLSFARTILREPKILILDEATSNIDTETEILIQDGLENMQAGRSTIMIAHRLSTVKNADQIYVLRHGKIIEQGKHDELIANEGYYYDMYRLQTYQGQV